jgi:hypothetical protein
MDIIEILHELSENEPEKHKAFRERLTEYCMNTEHAVIVIFRILSGMEEELSECLFGVVKVDVDKAVIIKVLKAVKIEIEIIRYRMKNPEAFELEFVNAPPPAGIWTDEKLNLIELIYAICKTKSVNNGNIKMKAIQRCLEYVFQVKLGNISNRIEEMDIRKENDKLYLEILLNNLSNFLDDMNA